jgi:hypothetical protein
VQSNELIRGGVKSCGCLVTTHGHTVGYYSTWVAMRSRCRSPTHSAYRYYGGRGIKVCDRWDLFENFLADMGERPEGMTLDRIDPDGNYEPGNCRSTHSEQMRNTRRSRKGAAA